MSAVRCRWCRRCSRADLGRHKWHDRRILLDRRDALGLGSDEQLLLLDADGAVLESERANLFAVSGAVVSTPPADGRILVGTTRELVIRAASFVGFEVRLEPLALDELSAADEVFLTSAIRGITAVGKLRPDRSFKVGPVSAQLAERLWALWHTPTGADRAAARYAPAAKVVPIREDR